MNPASTPPSPITTQLRSPTLLMLERLQPMESSSGLRKMASVKSMPMDMVMMTKAAARTVQP